MNRRFHLSALAEALLGLAVLLLVACGGSPHFTSSQATALIQARFDQQPPVSATVMVNDDGMRAGVIAKYWDRSKAYPNRYWADFKLTDTGKKVVKLPGGGDIIEWHPDSPADARYQIAINPVAANHLKAENAQDPQDGAQGSKTVLFDEVTSLEGIPDPVQQMARDSETKVATQRTATFALENGSWALQSIN